MSVPHPHLDFSPRAWAVVITIEVLLIFAAAGTATALYYQNRTQNSICTVFKLFRDQAQNGIATNAGILKIDLAQGKKQDAAVRRKSISESTSFLITIKHVSC